ncbi:MAG: hypothetical protein IJP04_03710, partial [Clostridia bacterium]|nr:hypothetical protein [Clostridia bacterium]
LLTRKTEGDFVQWTDYELLAPLTGPAGYCGTPFRDENTIIFRGFITTACEDPVLAIKWLDYWYSPEGMDWTNYGGPEGVGYEWVDEPAINGNAKSINNWEEPENNNLPMSYGVPFIQSEETYTNYAMSTADNVNGTFLLPRKHIYTEKAVPQNIPDVVWCQDLDLVAERAELGTLINEYVMASATEFVLGVRDINDDAQWEAYLNELDAMGLEHYIEVLETYYFGE